jgi:hypothetical protein
MTVWALTALLVAVGRRGRFGEALVHARRAAVLAAEAHDTRSLPLQPKFFLGLALADCDLVGEARAAYREALDDEFGSGWWLSETLMADAQASFVIGEWEDAVPGLIAGGQAAQEKGNLLLVSQSLAYRAIMATATGDQRAASELAAAIPLSPEGDQLSYNAGILAFAVAGLKAAEGDHQGAYDLLLRCWRSDAARDNRFYHRWLAPDLVRLALGLGHRDVAAEVADTVAAGVALAPEVPTLIELGYPLKGDAIQHLYAPKGLPPAIRKKLIDVFTEASLTKNFIDIAKQNALYDPKITTGEALDAYLLKDRATNKALIEKLGLGKKK